MNKPATPSAAEESFGKPPAETKTVEPPKQLNSHLSGKFSRWEKGTVFKLENGQVWKATGDDNGYYPNVPDHPPVTITRGFLGAYWMVVEPTGRKIKVKRIR